MVAHGVLALGRGGDVLAVWASQVGEALDWGGGSRIDVERRLLGAAAALEGLEATGALGAGADTAINRKWWDFMADIMETNEDNSPVSMDLPVLFHLD